MEGLRFIWWSLRIPTEKDLETATKEEFRQVRELLAEGKYGTDEARDRAHSYLVQSVAPLFVYVGLVSGIVGSLIVAVTSHFLNAPVKSPLAAGNRGWAFAGGFALAMMYYVGLWADRMQQRYRLMGVAVAKAAGGDVH